MAITYVSFDPDRQQWKYQRVIKPMWRGPLGRRQFCVWLDPDRVPPRDTPTAKGKAIAETAGLRQQHDQLFTWLESLTEEQRADLEAKGGLPGMDDRARDYALAAWDMRRFIEHVGEPQNDTQAANLWRAQRNEQAYRDEAQQARAIVLKSEPPKEYNLDALLQVWIDHQGADWRGRTGDHGRSLELLKDVLGSSADYRHVSQTNIGRFRDHLQNSGQSWSNQVKHLERISALFSAAVSECKIAVNPCRGISVRGENPENRSGRKERSFTGAQVDTVLRKAAETEFGGSRHEQAMWLVRLLTYAGLRPQEAAQLRKCDVYVLDGVPVVHVRAQHEQQSVKNAESVRIVPLHPAVAGFVEFARASKTDFIFDAFPYNKEKGRAIWLVQNFGKMLRGDCAIADKNLTLYSLRHRFHRAMDNAKIDQERQRVLTGHASPKVHDKYGRGADLALLARDMARIDPLA